MNIKNHEGSDFIKKVKETNKEGLLFGNLETLQVNLGNVCNQSCKHCHVKANPDGTNVMDEARVEDIMLFLTNNPGLTLDLTGGEPSMHPQIERLIDFSKPITKKIIVRTNLTALIDDNYKHLPEFYKKNKVEVIASMPCYMQENVDCQRGEGSFEKSILSLRSLNKIGYGKNEDLKLNLVYNPSGAFLPPDQHELQKDYKKALKENYGVVFNNLYTITNAPLGRFAEFLKTEHQYEKYMQALKDNFNVVNLDNIMCKNLISIDWEGKIYNCDFNQTAGIPIKNNKSSVINIRNLNLEDLKNTNIATSDHCFACTAGNGSSCNGVLKN